PLDGRARLSGSGHALVSGTLEGAAMTASREAFLKRVRRAVEAGNRTGQATKLEPRGAIGYQGAGPDPASRFCEAFAIVGGHAHRVPDAETAIARVLELVQAKSIRRIILGGSTLLAALKLSEHL